MKSESIFVSSLMRGFFFGFLPGVLVYGLFHHILKHEKVLIPEDLVLFHNAFIFGAILFLYQYHITKYHSKKEWLRALSWCKIRGEIEITSLFYGMLYIEYVEKRAYSFLSMQKILKNVYPWVFMMDFIKWVDKNIVDLKYME